MKKNYLFMLMLVVLTMPSVLAYDRICYSLSSGVMCIGNGQISGINLTNTTINASQVLNPPWLLTTDQRFNDTVLANSKAAVGDCPGGFVQNITTTGPQCAVAGSGTGTVTQVDTGTGLQGGPITTTGTLTLDTTYTDSLYYSITNPDAYVTMSNVVSGVGNWSGDKTAYNTTTQNYNIFLNKTDQRYNETSLITTETNSRIGNDSQINTSDNIVKLYAQNQKDPQGFPDVDSTTANTHSILAFNTTTHTFSISPTSGSFGFYVQGVYFNKTTTQSLQISNTSGMHVIYFLPNGTLSEAADTLYNILCNDAIVAIVSWDAPQGKLQMMADERHSRYMQCNVHNYLHEHLGTQYDGGLTPNVTVGGSTTLNTSAQWGSSAGSISDEDYTHNINAYIFPGNYRVYYQLGATGNWSWKQDNYSFLYKGDASGCTGATKRICFNQNTGGTWTLTQVTANNNYVLFHVFATNSYSNTTDMIVVEGQNEYSTLALARTGADTEINNIRSSGLFGSEYKPLYTFTVQTSDQAAWSNLPAAIIVAPSTGGSFVDWRTTNLNGATGTSLGGTVSLVQTGTGLTGGPITTTGTISLDTTYTDTLYYSISNPNNYYNSSTIPNYALQTSLLSVGNWTNDKVGYVNYTLKNTTCSSICSPDGLTCLVLANNGTTC